MDYVNWGKRILNKAEEAKETAKKGLDQYNDDLKDINIILDSILREKTALTAENDLYKVKMKELQDAVDILVNRHGYNDQTLYEMEQRLKRDINKG